jgi:hypothetical protein
MLLIRTIWLLLVFFPLSWTEIGRKNTAIREASNAYGKAAYDESVEKHLRLSSEFAINSANLTFNLGLSYHYNNQLDEAQRTYSSLLSDADKTIASFASNQVGVIQASQKKYPEALESFKFALIKNPNNEEARYNYELLSRWLEENPDQNQDDSEGEDEQKDDENQEQENRDEKKDSKDGKDGEGDEKSEEDEASESEKKEDKSGEKSQQEKESDEASSLESDLSDRQKAMEKMKERLQEMNLSPEQAAQILEAMNAAELRFIQQNRKKPTQRPNKGLPEW